MQNKLYRLDKTERMGGNPFVAVGESGGYLEKTNLLHENVFLQPGGVCGIISYEVIQIEGYSRV